MIQTTFVLVGALCGYTGKLGKFFFEAGRVTILASIEDTARYAQTLERNWQALPSNDPRVIAQEEALNGQRSVSTDGDGPDGASDVSGEVQPDGAGSDAGDAAAVEPSPAPADAGGAPELAEGDGHAPSVNEKLAAAIRSLDPTRDELWTKDGKPAVSAVETAYGFPGVTRADVEAALPGYTRATAAE